MASLVVIILLILFAIFAPLVAKLTGHGPNSSSAAPACPPTGCRSAARDVLARHRRPRPRHPGPAGLRRPDLATVGVATDRLAVVIGVVVGLAQGSSAASWTRCWPD